MKRAVLLALFALFTILAFGQQDKPAAYAVYEGYNYWNKQQGDTAYVFADVAYIRDYPATSAVLVDSLCEGTMLLIQSEGYNESTIRGFSAPWHEVSYQKDGQTKKGFIWLGLLALRQQLDQQGNQFLYGLSGLKEAYADEGSQYTCVLKYLSPQHKRIAEISFPVENAGQSYTDGKLLSNMGLPGLQAIYRVGFYGEACAVPTTHYYMGWDGQHFVNMLTKNSVSDAGVYYYEENVLFPSEHHLDPTLIIKDIVEGEVIDMDALEPEYKETRHREKYRWENQELIQILEMK